MRFMDALLDTNDFRGRHEYQSIHCENLAAILDTPGLFPALVTAIVSAGLMRLQSRVVGGTRAAHRRHHDAIALACCTRDFRTIVKSEILAETYAHLAQPFAVADDRDGAA